MSTAAASEAAPFNTRSHVNNTPLYLMHCSVYLHQSTLTRLPLSFRTVASGILNDPESWF